MGDFHQALFYVRLAAHVSTGWKSLIHPSSEKDTARKYRVPDRVSSEGCAIRQVEILSNKLLTTAFEASLECITVM